MNRIGTVEILRARVYNLDAESHDPHASTVVVEPGEYELYSDDLSTFWIMRGKLNMRGLWNAGDGMFLMRGHDKRSDIDVVFPSRRFGATEWADMLKSPEATEGHAGQRVRVTLTGGAA